MKKNNIINEWLDQYGDPEIEKFVAKNLAIVDKVLTALEDKGWSKGDLAKAMGKNNSEVTKWLSGMHNLTLKSIIKMEVALDINLLHTEAKKETVYIQVPVVVEAKPKKPRYKKSPDESSCYTMMLS